MSKRDTFKFLKSLTLTTLMLIGLSACDDDEESGEGYIALYNASANAPAIFITLDEDLEDDGTDYFEHTFSSVPYGYSSGNNIVNSNEYFLELAWQSDDSFAREDLTLIHEDKLTISKDEIKFVVIADDITNPTVLSYDIPVVDDESDDENNLFNVRFLNMHSNVDNVDLYISHADETFNEATLLGEYSYGALTDNIKLEQDDYIFYITQHASDEVLFQSEEINYSYASQYVMIIRENSGAGSSPFILDKVSGASAVSYLHDGLTARFKVFNGITAHSLLPLYTGQVDIYLNGVEQPPLFSSLNAGSFSESLIAQRGDYSLELTTANSHDFILKNHLITLNKNIDRTIFFYLNEENVDHDGDGDVDENGDGYVDEIKVTVNSLVVDNSTSKSIYDHNINIINLVDEDDFSAVNVYFVRNDEVIDTAANKKTVGFGVPKAITLVNNTYTVYAVAKQDSSDILLATYQLTLDLESKDQFLLMENDINSPTGYKITFSNQVD